MSSTFGVGADGDGACSMSSRLCIVGISATSAFNLARAAPADILPLPRDAAEEAFWTGTPGPAGGTAASPSIRTGSFLEGDGSEGSGRMLFVPGASWTSRVESAGGTADGEAAVGTA